VKSSHKFLGRSPDCLWWIGLALVITGCGGRGGLPCVESSSPDLDSREASATPFDDLQIQVGVDASESMLGFVSRPGSRYAQAIASLHTLLQNKNVPTTYWRIGSNSQMTNAQKITASQFLGASKLPFYCQRGAEKPDYPCVSSTLSQIFELPSTDTIATPSNEAGATDDKTSPPLQTLKILLTDLEPDNNAVGKLSGLISTELKSNPAYKTVLLGVRSHYEGNVYSADGSFSPFTYKTMGQDIDQKGRPFYILITGPQATVDELVREFRRLPLDVNRAFRASAFELQEGDTVTLDNTNLKGQIQPCVDEIGLVQRKRPNADQVQDWLLIEQGSCTTNANDSLPALELNVPSKPTVSLTGGDLTPDLFKISDPLVTVKKAQITPNPSGEGSRLLLTTIFNGEMLERGEDKLVYVTLDDRQLDQAVWKDWNMDISKPEGSKTQNLLLFVSGLRGAVANNQNAVKFCLGYRRY
jgi:hypothetical protein